MQNIKTPLYQAHQIRQFEQLASERFAITPSVLMQRAGKAAFDFMQRRWPNAEHITIFCGGGNNGGDGYVLASLAHERGLKVSIVEMGDQSHLGAEAKEAKVICQKLAIPMTPFNHSLDLHHPDLIVDAICGIGLHEPLREEVIAAIHKITHTQSPIFAIDIPTGVDGDTGKIFGEALRATATITFIGIKIGLLTGSGIAYTGELAVNDLQLPSDLFSYIEPVAKKIHLSSYLPYLKPRTRDWHKGLSGHVLVIGGDLGFSGAPRMAGLAALRVGAGLVTIATQPENALMMNAMHPELMCYGVSEPLDLNPLLERADVVVFGPGIGQSEWARSLWSVVKKLNMPLVIDADGLNLLAGTKDSSDHWVLTPHPGEAGRLLGTSSENVQGDRLAAIKTLQKRYGGVAVLKGAGTLVLAENALPALCDKGNPGMASAGMGDILSGVIGGLLAQNVPMGDAAKLGVCLHAMAGDLAMKDGERGMMATDLLPFIRRLANNPSN